MQKIIEALNGLLTAVTELANNSKVADITPVTEDTADADVEIVDVVEVETETEAEKDKETEQIEKFVNENIDAIKKDDFNERLLKAMKLLKGEKIEMGKKPSVEKIVEIIVGSGASAEQGAESAAAINDILLTSADGNDFLVEFNNAIEQRYNDVHSNATIYDSFKKFRE